MKYCHVFALLGVLVSSCLAQDKIAASEKGKSIEIRELEITFHRISPEKYGSTGSDYYLMETEVTNKMYHNYLAETGKKKGDGAVYALMQKQRQQDMISTVDPVYDIENKDLLWANNTYPEGEGQLPVTLVTERQATEFCDWLTGKYGHLGLFRIPTKDEWLIAAYGEDRRYPWGNQLHEKKFCFSRKVVKNSQDHPKQSPEPVKQRLNGRTTEGLYGIWGNVHEIVRGYGNGVWMGGSYKSTKDRFPARADYWGYTHEDTSYHEDVGFRVLLEPAGEEWIIVTSRHMREKEKQRNNDYDNRYNELPIESRAILRARSLKGDSDMSRYQQEISKARKNLDPKLINQLTALLGYDKPYGIEADSTLGDIFCKTWLIKSEPSFLMTDNGRKKAIQVLLNSFSHVGDRSAFDHHAHLFMKVSGIRNISFTVPNTVISIRKELGNEGEYISDDRGAVADYKWREEIQHVRTAFVKWWTQQSQKSSTELK